ncbi:MAG: hypothetical protein P4L22_05385 [Candidatus Babeliales bacterium]|nr:hypothetical protein [Candidatus Babeliales bacterium]
MNFLRVLLVAIIIVQSTQLISWELPKLSMPESPAFVTTLVEASKPYLTKKAAIVATTTLLSGIILYKLSAKESSKNEETKKTPPSRISNAKTRMPNAKARYLATKKQKALDNVNRKQAEKEQKSKDDARIAEYKTKQAARTNKNK